MQVLEWKFAIALICGSVINDWSWTAIVRWCSLLDEGCVDTSTFIMWYFFRSGRFTSLSMIRALLSLQTYVCATIHLNRGFPACAAFTKEEAKSLKRGQSLYATSADKKILAEAWKDSKPVYWLSSAIAESTSNTVVRRCKAQSLTIGWHAVIASYNGGMDGLDDVDASRSYFAMHFRRLKWCWLNLFFWLLEIALNNALVLYNAMVEFKSLRQKRCKGV